MKSYIVYPLPFDAWDTFKPFAERFADTFKEFPPGADYELLAVCNWGEPTDDERRMFRGIKTRFIPYYGNGCDFGSHQEAARYLALNYSDGFLVCCTSRIYFHRPDWLHRLDHERVKYGPGLYGTSASHEGGHLHICTRMFGVEASHLLECPIPRESRDNGTMFEVGALSPHGSYTDWIESKGLIPRLVTFDGCYEKPAWFTVPNRFRSGDQSNMLAFDKHTDAYRDADAEEKARLEEICNPKK